MPQGSSAVRPTNGLYLTLPDGDEWLASHLHISKEPLAFIQKEAGWAPEQVWILGLMYVSVQNSKCYINWFAHTKYITASLVC